MTTKTSSYAAMSHQRQECKRWLSEIERQLRSRNGYPFDPRRLSRALRSISKGDFGTIGGIHTLAEMLAAGEHDSVDSDITEENFPVNPALYTTEGCRRFSFDKSMKTPQVIAAIRRDGYEPDGIEKLLAYGAEHRRELGDNAIVGLGCSVLDRGRDRVYPCLDYFATGRSVTLYGGCQGGRWDAYRHEFLASPKVQR